MRSERICDRLQQKPVLLKRQAMNSFMLEAINEAKKGLMEGGIPIGSVIIKNAEIVGQGHNRRVQKNSAILHAEMDALESVGRQPASFYKNVTLYTTLSPCSMCSGAKPHLL